MYLLVLAVAFYAPVTFGDREMAGGDTVRWRAMAESVLDPQAGEAERPLWAMNPFAGMPAFMVYYPMVVPQIDDVARTMRRLSWPIFQFLILLGGVYALTFFLTGMVLPAALAATAFGMTTYIPIILLAGHASKFVALSYAPWLLLTFAYVLRRPSLLAGLVFAIVAAINLRAGHIQITYNVTILAGIWWLVEGIGALREGKAKPFLVSTAWLAAGAIAAVLMVAHPYWPQAEYKQYTIRGAAPGGLEASGLDWSYAMAWSQGWTELLTLLIAGAMGETSRTGLYWGPKVFTEGPHYLGGIVLTLAVLGYWLRRRRVAQALGIGAVVLTLFSLGDHAAFVNRPLFRYFPLFDAFRAPEIWLHTVELALAVLAGLGAARLLQLDAERDRRRVLYVVAAMAALSLGLLAGRETLFSFDRPDEENQIAVQVAQMQQRQPNDPEVRAIARQTVARFEEQRSEVFRDDAARTLLFLLLAGVALFLFDRRRLPGWLLVALLALLVAIDLWGVGRRHFNDELLPEREAEAQIAAYPADEFVRQQVADAGGPGRFRTVSLIRGLTDNARPAYHYETLSGYHGAKLRLYQDYLDNILVDPVTGSISENGLDLTSVRYVLAGRPLPGMRVAFEDQISGLLVLERPDYVPRAYLVGETEVIPEPERAYAQLRSPGFDLRRKAILAEPPALLPAPIDSQSTASVQLESYGPEEIRWRVQTDAPRLLVAHEVYYPAGWTAEIDGEPAEIVRANHFLRAVAVPAGEHEVRMQFRSQRHATSVRVSGVTTALVYGLTIVLLGLQIRRRRRDAKPNDT